MTRMSGPKAPLGTREQYTGYDAGAYNESPQLRDPLFTAHEIPIGGSYVNYFVEPLDSTSAAFPGLFYTTFDEQNPLPGFGDDEHTAMGGYEESEGTPRNF